jgi:hypothetical protein
MFFSHRPLTHRKKIFQGDFPKVSQKETKKLLVTFDTKEPFLWKYLNDMRFWQIFAKKYSRNFGRFLQNICYPKRCRKTVWKTGVGDEYCLGGVLWKQQRLLAVEYVTNNFSRRYTTQKWQIQQTTRVRYFKVNLRFYQIINRIITIGLPRNLPCESRLDK